MYLSLVCYATSVWAWHWWAAGIKLFHKTQTHGSVIYGISDQYHKVDNMMISEYTGSCISLRLSSFPPRHLYVHTFRIPYPPLIQPIR